MPTATNPPPRDEPPIPVRLDACPGMLRLHMADDGALARVRVPGGVLTAAQAAALADAAVRLGDGALHLTSRGNVQLRGLDGECGAALAGLLDAAGLLPSYRHERVRNIVASPLSGLDGAGHADVRPWLRALDGLLCASEAATALSGRFLFALDDGRGDVAALGPDVTLIACDGGDALLRVGTHPTAVRVPAAHAARAALTAAEAFLDAAAEVRAAGRERVWRVSDLPEGAGALLRRTAEVLHESGVSAAYEANAFDTDVADVSGAGEAADRVHAGPAAPPSPGTYDSPDGTRALSVVAPLGQLTAAQWQLLVTLAREDGSGELRLTPWRGVLVPGLPRDRAAARLHELTAAGLVTGPDSPWTGVGACIGRPGCAKSLADVRADAAIALGTGGGLPVYWSGCERRCGHPQGDWVDVVATGDGYRVSLRGAGVRTVMDGTPDMNGSSHVNGSTDVPEPTDLAVAVAAARTTTAATANPATQATR